MDGVEGVRYIIGESRKLLTDRRFLGYVLVCALGTSTYFAFLGAGPHVVVSMMARTSAEYGLWFIITAAAFMAGNFITTRTVQRYGVDRMIAVGLAFQVVGAVATIIAVWLFPDGGPMTIFLPQIAMSVGNGIFLPNCVAGAVSVRTQAAGTAPQTNVTVVAKGLKFETKTVVVPAKTNVTVALDNQDGGTLHNFAVYRAKDAKDVIHRGELFEGREKKEETWESPEAGVYYFRCDAHPDMNGAFVVR